MPEQDDLNWNMNSPDMEAHKQKLIELLGSMKVSAPLQTAVHARPPFDSKWLSYRASREEPVLQELDMLAVPRWKIDLGFVYYNCEIQFLVRPGEWAAVHDIKVCGVQAEYGELTRVLFTVFIAPKDNDHETFRISPEPVHGWHRLEYKHEDGTWETLNAAYKGPTGDKYYHEFTTELDDIESFNLELREVK